MYSAELANRPIPRELDGGGAGALIAEKVTLIRFTADSPIRLRQEHGLVGKVKQVKHKECRDQEQ